jgi:hypothetical protein
LGWILGNPCPDRAGIRRGSVLESLSLEWSIASNDEEFERGLEEASIEGLSTLSDELDEEETRLRRLYEQARGEEQRRLIKGMIRQVEPPTPIRWRPRYWLTETTLPSSPQNAAHRNTGIRIC